MIRRDRLQDNDNHERWLVSYSDFMTLLFGFFVVMYAISSVNEGKYRVLSATLTETFHAQPKSLEPIQVGEPLLAASPHVIDVPDVTGYQDESAGDSFHGASDLPAPEALTGIIEAEGVTIQANNDWVEISLDASLMFGASSATLSAAASRLLANTASYLGSFDNALTIEGYTDNMPVSGGPYRSNWELSAARAGAVAEFLMARGIERERLAAVGYGENHPLETNATPEGRAANRRVVVVVARRSNLARNLNAGGPGALAYVRQAEAQALDDAIRQVRTQDGGLLFTADPEVEPPADGSPSPGG